MKLAISSSGKNLDAQLDPRFGRCAYFLIVDPADMRYEVFDNQSAAQSSGAGIQAAQFLADKNVSAVITGHVGPNAVQTLAAAGIAGLRNRNRAPRREGRRPMCLSRICFGA